MAEITSPFTSPEFPERSNQTTPRGPPVLPVFQRHQSPPSPVLKTDAKAPINNNNRILMFAYGNITLMVSATLSSNKDRLMVLMLLFESYSLDYFFWQLSDSDLYIEKGLWMLAVFIIGIILQPISYPDAKLAVKFLLVLVPQKYRPAAIANDTTDICSD
ncbi:Uncharacterized protein Fot_49302 [Forsythia ovata]|uniref:Uncharacterized protein n=1 Tax=Forsythia ovata TaxID=205694 RepID=A0ABD1QBQ1_9LAMI